ncbi:MAG: lipid-A-disaccharide synthase [Candidatus Kapaibacterium sp.]
MKKILIVSGDPSGDLHSSLLMREIRKLKPEIQFIGIGGEKMIAEGLEALAPMSEVSVVGFWEVAKKYNFFKNLLDKCKDIIKKGDIDIFIPVDYPGFNIRLAEFSKNFGVPVYYYIAPQLWAWGKNRSKKLARVVDKLLVVFPFEVEYFSNFGIDTKFIGHPLLDNKNYSENFMTNVERNGKIAFFPGSRKQEIRKHLDLFVKILKYNEASGYKHQFTVARSSNIPLSEFSMLSLYKNVEICSDNIGIMRTSSAGIIKTGTSNLEAALSGMPFAMFYKTSFLTYTIAERLVNLPYISIVNILSNQFVIQEFIQQRAEAELILDYINMLMKNQDEYRRIQNQFLELRKNLGEGGASLKAAEHILEAL